jgi:hypothetical protein
MISSNEKISPPAVSKDSCNDGVARLPYSKPILRVYGAVSELTKGGSGSGTDGVNMTMMR